MPALFVDAHGGWRCTAKRKRRRREDRRRLDLLYDILWMEMPFFLAAGVVIGLNIVVAVADWVKRKITGKERDGLQSDGRERDCERWSE
jgi:hypothetical protein